MGFRQSKLELDDVRFRSGYEAVDDRLAANINAMNSTSPRPCRRRENDSLPWLIDPVVPPRDSTDYFEDVQRLWSSRRLPRPMRAPTSTGFPRTRDGALSWRGWTKRAGCTASVGRVGRASEVARHDCGHKVRQRQAGGRHCSLAPIMSRLTLKKPDTRGAATKLS